MLNEKNALRFSFGPHKVPQQENMHFHIHAFLVGHFPRSKIEFKSIFFIMYYIITILKKMERFCSYLTKSNNGFPITFSNLARKGSKVFFKLGRWFVCQRACIYLLISCGGPKSFDIDIAYFISQYSYPLAKWVCLRMGINSFLCYLCLCTPVFFSITKKQKKKAV